MVRPIAFLASYPRSGNTFLRALLANYESNLDRPLTAQEVALYGRGEKDEAFMRLCTGLDAHSRTIEACWAARSRYLELTRELPGTGPIIFKTHTLNGSIAGTPAFQFQPDDRIVYIVRHPLDVTVSGAHFFGIGHEGMADQIQRNGASTRSNDAFFEVTGSWLENVAGWMNEGTHPLLLVKYENLCARPINELRRVLKFLGRPVLHKQLHRAVRHTSFEGLRRSQIEEGFDQGPGRDRRAAFFRNGQPNQWRTALPEHLVLRLDAQFGPLMEILGYERAAVGARRRRRAAEGRLTPWA